MQTQKRILDDLARVANSTLGVAVGMRDEIEARLREQFERILAQMDVVPREEFDAVKAMAAKARAEQEQLAKRLSALEAQLGHKAGAPGKDASGKKGPTGGKAAKQTGTKGPAI